MDDESEQALAEIQDRTGLSVSEALKRGLVDVRNALRADASASPWGIYEALDLGPGGYARAPAREAKSAIRKLLRERSGR